MSSTAHDAGVGVAVQKLEQDSPARKRRRLSADAKLAASAGMAMPGEQRPKAEPAAGGLYRDLRPMTRTGSAMPPSLPPLTAAAEPAQRSKLSTAPSSAVPRAAWPMDAGAKHRKVCGNNMVQGP
jgi:hypothetical protein